MTGPSIPNPLARPNPLAAFIPALGGDAPEAERAAPGAEANRRDPIWGTVQSVDPLRVIIPPDTEAQDVTPTSLVPQAWLSSGVRVRVEWQGRTMVVADRVWTSADSTQWESLTLGEGAEAYTAFGRPEWRLEAGVVRLAGTIRNTGEDPMGTSDAPLALLPPSATPSASRLVTLTTNNGDALAYIAGNGTIYVRSADALNTGWWASLEGITYRL